MGRSSPLIRISLGLVMLTTTILFVLDLFAVWEHHSVCGHTDDAPLKSRLASQALELRVVSNTAHRTHDALPVERSSALPLDCKCTRSTEMSAGVTPEIREACPNERGRTVVSFSRDSLRIPVRLS